MHSESFVFVIFY